jgi:uncharacterized membrane protein YoaK (UPF0700 family)
MTASTRAAVMTDHIRAHTRKRLRLWLMMVLTFVTGMLDAVGYLGLDRIFTGNMTGNIVILGMGVAAEDSLPVAGPAIALGAYVLGAAVAGRLVLRHKPVWKPVVTAVFVVSACAMTAAATILALFHVSGPSALGIAVAASIAMLMGAQAATARALAVADMTTVVVTSTITAYAAETLFNPGLGWLTHRRLWAVLAIFAGAVTGALLMKIDISVPVYLAAGATAVVALVGHVAWEDTPG